MRRHVLTLRAILPALAAVVSLTVVSVAGQARPPPPQGSAALKSGIVPRTADGHPDLQGLLVYRSAGDVIRLPSLPRVPSSLRRSCRTGLRPAN